MNENLKANTSNRIWEIDAVRGVLILLMLLQHLYYTVDALIIGGHYNVNPYEWIDTFDPCHIFFDWGRDGIIFRSFWPCEELGNHVGIALFFVISGICCTFSRNFLVRISRLLLAGSFIAAFTYGLYVFTGDEARFIRFGVILCYAVCLMIYHVFLERMNNYMLVMLSIPMLLVGYYLQFNPVYSHSAILYLFGHEYGVMSSEYFPIFPFLGWMLVGVVCGRLFYQDKKSLLPFTSVQNMTRPLQWLGRHSGLLYVIHIVVYPVLFLGIGFL